MIGKLACPHLLPLLHPPRPREGGLLFLERPKKGSLLQAGCTQGGDCFHCFCSPVGRRVGSQPRTVSLFLQNSGVRGDLPTLVCLCHICSSTHVPIQTRPGLCHSEGILVAGPVYVLQQGHQSSYHFHLYLIVNMTIFKLKSPTT